MAQVLTQYLAFSATEKYTNHDIVKFLESIGAEFGPCQNPGTSADETIYELFVPVDKLELLSHSISVLAEFSTEVRVSANDLEKERGAVLEEYRGSINSNGRMQDAHWVLMMEGSKGHSHQLIYKSLSVNNQKPNMTFIVHSTRELKNQHFFKRRTS